MVVRGLSPPPAHFSSVVVFGKVQGAQVAEAQAHALHVEGVDLPLLALQQVFDAVGSLLLKGTQLLFDLRTEERRGLDVIIIRCVYFFLSFFKLPKI